MLFDRRNGKICSIGLMNCISFNLVQVDLRTGQRGRTPYSNSIMSTSKLGLRRLRSPSHDNDPFFPRRRRQFRSSFNTSYTSYEDSPSLSPYSSYEDVPQMQLALPSPPRPTHLFNPCILPGPLFTLVRLTFASQRLASAQRYSVDIPDAPCSRDGAAEIRQGG